MSTLNLGGRQVSYRGSQADFLRLFRSFWNRWGWKRWRLQDTSCGWLCETTVRTGISRRSSTLSCTSGGSPWPRRRVSPPGSQSEGHSPKIGESRAQDTPAACGGRTIWIAIGNTDWLSKLPSFPERYILVLWEVWAIELWEFTQQLFCILLNTEKWKKVWMA